MSRTDDKKIKYRLKVDCVVKASTLKQAIDAFYAHAIKEMQANVGKDSVEMSLFIDTPESKAVLHGQFDLSPVNHQIKYDLMGMPQ